jgi:paired amphipathic helix protein Sin3a
LEALHNCPAVAIPVVLRRLKQKNEEWRRSQREWNKIWREIDARNFYKSLDHQGINFKTSDRKSMNPKTLIQEIEVLHKEQKQRSNSTNRYQFDFSFKYKDIFQAVNKILIKAMENNTTVNQSEEQKIKTELLPFLQKMFLLPQNFLEFEAESDDDDEEDDGSSSEKSEKIQDVKPDVATLDVSDKEELSKGEKKSKALTQAGKLKALSEQQDQPFTKVSQQSSAFNTLTERSTLTFYSNSSFYIFFRLYQVNV